MTHKLYVISPPAYIFDRIQPEIKKHIVCLPDFLRFPPTKIKQLTRSLLLGRLPLPKEILYFWFPKQQLDVLLEASQGDAILFYECCNLRVLRTIKSLLPKGVPCYIYYCNPIQSIFTSPTVQLKAIKQQGYLLSCFDPQDAKKYHLTLTGQYFCYPESLSPDYKYDCFFCGLPKDRLEELCALEKLLKENALTCQFIIPKRAEERIDYSSYLNRLSQARCVIDITQKNQLGLTRRPLEALFFNKKLITNNPNIQSYDFYNPKNIFIFGKDPTGKIKDFMQNPIEPVADSVKKKYDINEWIKHYLPK